MGYEWDTHGRLLKIDGFNNKTFTVIGDGVYIPFPVWGSSEFFSFRCNPMILGVRLTPWRDGQDDQLGVVGQMGEEQKMLDA